ncbi:GNAT family N-acetyltransferase [Paraburkholderia sp. A1RI-2L]|uniref:GNAT family N-acetyltransferase n=1 Tax=Paraburkholderia sp. A1RI-2L TaxID=3028367 RepID=UPI003B80F752
MPMSFVCRPARADDAAVCAPLVFASGEPEFGFMLGVPAEACIDFLAGGFRSRHGRFSFRRHRVVVNDDNEVCSVMAIHEGGRVALDDVVLAWHVWRHFGVMRAIGILTRGARLATELPAPARGQSLIAHCATRPEWRSRGALTTLMNDVLKRGGQQFVLDVRLENHGAIALYRRLGFQPMERKRARHPRLPSAVVSERMSIGG